MSLPFDVDAVFASPTWLIAAHADDEVIGLGAQLRKFKNLTLIHATDSTPPSVFFAERVGFHSLQDYRAARAREAERVCKAVGIASHTTLPIGDQRLAFKLSKLIASLNQLLDAVPREQQPKYVITHSYEGGHPDHDALAIGVRRFLKTLPEAAQPHHLEMLSYHIAQHSNPKPADHRIDTTQFLNESDQATWMRPLSEEERLEKQRLLSFYASQVNITSLFEGSIEKLRLAPTYDFTRPPHRGSLYYETLGWPSECITTWQSWREAIAQSLR